MADAESKHNESVRRPFFIATAGGYDICSDHIVSINGEYKHRGKIYTEVLTDGGDRYYDKGGIHAPREVVKQLFAAHGYHFYGPEDLQQMTQDAAPNTPKGP